MRLRAEPAYVEGAVVLKTWVKRRATTAAIGLIALTLLAAGCSGGIFSNIKGELTRPLAEQLIMKTEELSDPFVIHIEVGRLASKQLANEQRIAGLKGLVNLKEAPDVDTPLQRLVYDIALTEKGKDVFSFEKNDSGTYQDVKFSFKTGQDEPRKAYNFDWSVYKAEFAHAEITEITGIALSGDGKSAKVEYKWKVVLSPWVQENNIRWIDAHIDEKKDYSQRPGWVSWAHTEPSEAQANFALYDDGWRVTKNYLDRAYAPR